LGGGCRLWFPDVGGWFAFYDANGVPQDAISWSDTLNFCTICNPCVPTSVGCPTAPLLASYDDIPAANKTFITDTFMQDFLGYSWGRIPDGGAWSVSPLIPTMGTCNASCIPPPVITCNGAATVIVTGGLAPYKYLWNDTKATDSVTAKGLCEGQYCVTVTDANGNTSSGCVNITNYIPPVTFSNIPPVCGSSAPINLTSYVFPPGGTFSGTGVTGSFFNPSVAGLGAHVITYIYSDVNSCSDTITNFINVFSSPAASLTYSAPSCNGYNNGTATVTPTYGDPPFSFLWSTGGNNSSITNLTAGNYTVKITDSTGCDTTYSLTISQPAVLTVSVVINSNVTCSNDGSATVSATGGIAPYTYLWGTTPIQSNSTINNLAAGTYSVTVTDNSGCTETSSATITQPVPLSLSITNADSILCFGQKNGSITVNASGGVSPYTYNWSNGQTGDMVTNLGGGTYTVTATDFCSQTATNEVVITVVSALTIVASPPDTTICFGTHVQLTASGGIRYSWSPSTGLSPNIGTVVSASPPSTQTYTVIGTNGTCSGTTNATVNVVNISLANSNTDEICGRKNGTATVNASGAIGGYTYLWSNGDTLKTDTGMAHGTYTVTVNGEGCSKSQSINVGEIPGPEAAFLYSPQHLTVLDGPVDFWSTSTGSIVSWLWSFGDTSYSSGINAVHPYPDIGTYVVTLIVTDTNGCRDTTSDTVKVINIFTFYIPDAFTPNGDNLNEYFAPKGMNVDPDNYSEYIYDRWGNLIFQTNKWNVLMADEGEADGWNGMVNNKGSAKDVIGDVYIYKILAKENGGPVHEYIGSITLMR
jgi:gliding motility-associated-like protein